MLLSITTAALALRAGLRLRRSRRAGRRRPPELRRRHLRLAKPAATLVLVGFIAGPLSMAWLRGREPFDTVHAWIGVTVALLFATTAFIGLRLERGRTRALDAHALAGLLAVAGAALAAVAGFVLLP